MYFDLEYDTEWVSVRPRQRNRLQRLLLRGRGTGVDSVAEADREVALALAEVRMVTEGEPTRRISKTTACGCGTGS